jgi:hypothetical protein
MNAPHQTQLFVLGCVYQGIGCMDEAEAGKEAALKPLVKHP